MSPVQSVELLLEPRAEQRVLRVWAALERAGLPSQAGNLAPSNRPHITLVAVPDLPADADAQLPEEVGGLPVAASWGLVAMFGNGPWTVVRLVEPSARMRALQARVARVCAVPADSLTTPERWTPHVTLARRVREEALSAVSECVAEALREPEDRAGAPLALTRVRRWDGRARREWPVPSPDHPTSRGDCVES